MTDIILGEGERSGRRMLLLVVVLLAAAGAGAWYWLGAREQEPPQAPPAPAAPAAPQAPAADAAAPLVEEALKLAAADNFRDARDKALEALAMDPPAATRRRAEELLNRISIDLVMMPRQMPEKIEYVVEAGDSLEKIAKKFGTTVELIRKGNNISGSIIRVGQRLRVLSGKFEIRVDKSDNTLTLFLNGKYFKRYPVGTGQYNRTPVGTFKITDKIAQPTWWRPDGKEIKYGDPENLLGTHWLAIDSPGYGIHGTWEPDTIGKQLSAGCVRLLNEDVEQLFTLVPAGTPVIIED